MVELLASMAIIGVLAVLCTGAFQGVLQKGKMVRETNAAKTLMTAYTLAASENDGRYLPGMDMTANSIWFEPKKQYLTTIHLPNRYPYRLAPYFDYNLKGTILVNENVQQIEKMAPAGNLMHDYIVSTYPALGINYWFVGGCKTGESTVTYPNDCITRMGQESGSILVFASGGSAAGGSKVNGYNILTPPKLEGDRWVSTPWTKERDPGSYGNVDARYDGRAVCAFLDGSVRILSIDDLRDMRLWNRVARERDDPNYLITY